MAAYATTTTIDRQGRPRRTRRRAVTIAVGALAAATAVGGVGAGAHATTAGSGGAGNFVEGGTFTYALGSDPGNLDPHMSVFVATNAVNTLAYDTLVNLGQDGTILPGLAESWEESPTSITYTLKDGITCADGTPLTATTVGDNFSFVADPANQSPLLGVQVPAGITVEADDAARTVTLTSPQPVPFFLQSTGAGLFIVCAKGLADRSILASGTDGTGPFVLTDAVPNDHYSFTVRDGYAWGPDGATTDVPGFPAAAEVRIVENESTAANLLLSGEVNAAEVAGPDRQRLEDEGYFSIENQAIVGEFFFNQMADLPTADVAVRQALMRALDLNQMMAVQTSGLGALADGLASVQPKVCPGDTVGDILSQGADLDAAGQMLDDAGWVMGSGDVREKDGQPLSIRAFYITEFEGAADAMELATAQWNQLGVDVDLQGVDSAQFNTLAFESRAWDVFLAAVNLDVPSLAVPFVSGPQPPDGVNFSAVSNPEYESLVAEASALTGPEACAKWDEAEKALYAQMNILPYAVTTAPVFGRNAEFAAGRLGLIPSSIRLFED
jgi:peptide/nickel transport system substrate-binding protein